MSPGTGQVEVAVRLDDWCGCRSRRELAGRRVVKFWNTMREALGARAQEYCVMVVW